VKKLLQTARAAGPYVAVEVFLPGGSLIALGMLAWANRKRLAERFTLRTCNPSDRLPSA
jgi:hypothetical protein